MAVLQSRGLVVVRRRWLALMIIAVTLGIAALIALGILQFTTSNKVEVLRQTPQCTQHRPAGCDHLLSLLLAACKRQPVCAAAARSTVRQLRAGPTPGREAPGEKSGPRGAVPRRIPSPVARTPERHTRTVAPTRPQPTTPGGTQPSPPRAPPTPAGVVEHVLADPTDALTHPVDTAKQLTCSLGVTACP